MNLIDLETAVREIKIACERSRQGPARQLYPFFFLVGAGISFPQMPLAASLEDECRKQARGYGFNGDCDKTQPIETYSFWFSKAYSQAVDRQFYLRS